ncbi:hypothetical protein IFM89_010967 [Coptis chinensis]|uniref:ATPase AAA-type core domain-containing protein n=1 Tax=Coptis chinensis TaxID=261450 RepID=A0A835IPC8_9MAGN|nr:hypothetical protein IFM89_010967 [Coptis chinensis]
MTSIPPSKAWMKEISPCPKYLEGVESFIKFAKDHSGNVDCRVLVADLDLGFVFEVDIGCVLPESLDACMNELDSHGDTHAERGEDNNSENNSREDIKAKKLRDDATRSTFYNTMPNREGKMEAENLKFEIEIKEESPQGSGKTLLATAVAKFFDEHEEILAHYTTFFISFLVFISCSRLSLEKALVVQSELKDYLSDALEHSPSLVIFDDLDNIVSSLFDSEGSQTSTSTTALVEFLTDIMDEHGGDLTSMCSFLLRPAVSERGAILKHEIRKRSLQCSEEILVGT